ncbi:MAG: twin-arginine translocation signal domain-containing protein, partial [Hyphomicrobiales bacterium]
MINRRKFLAGAAASGLTMPFLLKASLSAESGRPLPIPSVVSLDGAGNSVDAMYGSHSFLANGK